MAKKNVTNTKKKAASSTAKKKANAAKLAKKSTNKNTDKTEDMGVKDIDTMAKERVNKLLDDVNLTPKEKDSDVLVLDENNLQNLEWLQEQIDKLSNENEKLLKEAEEAKENYKKLHAQYQSIVDGGETPQKDLVPDSMLKNGVTELFDEFQRNFLGQNQEKRRYNEIFLKPLMIKMIDKFPFLKEMKRF